MNPNFIGQYTHSIDSKGRVIVPVKFKNALGDKFYLSIGLDGCLYIFPQDRWEAFSEQLNKLPWSNPRARELQRRIFSSSTDCEVDNQGRILINQDLREKAGLIKDVVFAGDGHRIEVWSKEKYDSRANLGSLEDLAGEFDDFGIAP